jgi:hypothetical protein
MSSSSGGSRIIYVQLIAFLNELEEILQEIFCKYIRLLILEPRLCTQGNAVGIWESSL